MKYWIMKTEPTTFSIDDLKKNKKTHWEGVRNYQARNFMRDEMQINDKVFIYHSNCKEPGITGIGTVIKTAYPDFTAFDPESDYYDPKSTPECPRWFMVDIKFEKKFDTPILLAALKQQPALKNMLILRKGNRLSITPITEKEWNTILKMERPR